MYAMCTDGWESVLEMAVDVYRPDNVEGGHDRPVLVSLLLLWVSVSSKRIFLFLFILTYGMCICAAKLRHHSISRLAEKIIRQTTAHSLNKPSHSRHRPFILNMF